MNAIHLNEHDANQGAQSSGEFLGMTGNSGWYLLGSAGATILMVILLWGILGLSLLMCLLLGVVLCTLSITYVFTLKNNKPEHYDTDFFESALIEAGVLELSFGPKATRETNPFTGLAAQAATPARLHSRQSFKATPRTIRRLGPVLPASIAATSDPAPVENPRERVSEKTAVTSAAYDELQERLHATEEQLAEALAERAED